MSTKKEAAEALRALRNSGLTDEVIKGRFPQYAHGWDLIDTPAGKPRGSGSEAVELKSLEPPFRL